MTTIDDVKTDKTQRDAALRQYLGGAQAAAQQAAGELHSLSTQLSRLESHLATANVDWSDAEWQSFVNKATECLQAAVPHVGLNPGRLLLELNATVANVQLLRKDPGLRAAAARSQ